MDKFVIVDTPTLVLAALTAVASFVSYLIDLKKLIFPISLGLFVLSSTTAAVLILGTGGTSSPFIALWMLAGVFAGIFGVFGTIPVLLATVAFVGFRYVDNNLNSSVIVVTVFGALLPLVAGLFIWPKKSGENHPDVKKLTGNPTELNELASKSEVVINAIGDGVIAIDSKGVIQLINPAAQNIIGWTAKDALSLSYKSVLQLVNQRDEALNDAGDPIQQSLNTNQEVRTSNLTLLTRSGKKLMISLVVSPVGDVGSGVITVFRDVTSEKIEEREQAEFISTASHEMRTPVASIEGYLGLALNPQTAQIDDRARDFILKAHAGAEHLGRLFQDLLDIAKSEDGRITNNPKVTNVVPLVHDIVQGLKQRAVEKGLQITFKPMPEGSSERFVAPMYYVNLDNDHIREIVDNLIENAIKYTPKGDITIDVGGDEEHVVVSVADSGVGIPPEDMSHLFQKFYRVDDKDTREIGGTGLGLYLSRKLAELMSGRIWAESTYGIGSTFYLELPRVSVKEAARLSDQEAFSAKIEATSAGSKPADVKPAAPPVNITATPVTPANPVTPAPPTKKVMEMINTVPRGEALTPEQKASLIAKQRALAQQNAVHQLSRPQSVSVPQRVMR